MNKLFAALDRFDSFLAQHPGASMLLSALLGLVIAVILTCLP